MRSFLQRLVLTFRKALFPPEIGTQIRGFVIYRMLGSNNQIKERLIDVGCGIGSHSLKLSRKGKCVIGVDINLNDLKEAKRWKDMLGISNADFVLASGFHLPFKKNSFDQALCSDVIEHLSQDQPLINEVGFVLRRDGIFVLSTPSIGTHEGKNRIPIRAKLRNFLKRHNQLRKLPIWNYGIDPDVFMKHKGHLREYHLHELSEKLRKAGLHLTDYEYCYRLFTAFVNDLRWSIRVLDISDPKYRFIAGALFPLLYLIATIDELLNIKGYGTGLVIKATKNHYS